MIFLPESHRGARRSRILLGALLSMVLSACSAGIDASIRSDLSATVAIGAEVPEALAAKLAQLRGAAPGGGAVAPLFDPAQARSGASERGLAVLEASAPTQRSFRGVFAVADLAVAAKGSGGIVSLVRSGGIVALTVRLDRSNAKSLPALFPGVDPYVIEALAPPAFDEAPLTRAEYRETLSAILGTKSLPAIDAAGVDLSLTLPALPFAVSGAAVEGRVVRTRLPLLDILMLERPFQISVSWRE